MRLVVCVPTYGRPALARRTIDRLARQTRRPDAVLVSAPDESHVERSDDGTVPVTYVFGALGTSAQRNRLLTAVCGRYDIVAFFDDDFLPADDYLAQVAAAFEANRDWTVLTGDVLRDGANDAGVGYEEAEAILARSSPVPPEHAVARDWHGGYGCNMSIRLAAVGTQRFDERLVLYGWLEDLDFTRRVAANGRIIKLNALRGVHMGTKSGRVNGMPFGYSQVVNPLYLVRKGSLTPRMASNLIARNLLANMGRLLYPEPWVDRRGRLLGNVVAVGHLISGQLLPEKARDFLVEPSLRSGRRMLG